MIHILALLIAFSAYPAAQDHALEKTSFWGVVQSMVSFLPKPLPTHDSAFKCAVERARTIPASFEKYRAQYLIANNMDGFNLMGHIGQFMQKCHHCNLPDQLTLKELWQHAHTAVTTLDHEGACEPSMYVSANNLYTLKTNSTPPTQFTIPEQDIQRETLIDPETLKRHIITIAKEIPQPLLALKQPRPNEDIAKSLLKLAQVDYHYHMIYAFILITTYGSSVSDPHPEQNPAASLRYMHRYIMRCISGDPNVSTYLQLHLDPDCYRIIINAIPDHFPEPPIQLPSTLSSNAVAAAVLRKFAAREPLQSTAEGFLLCAAHCIQTSERSMAPLVGRNLRARSLRTICAQYEKQAQHFSKNKKHLRFPAKNDSVTLRSEGQRLTQPPQLKPNESALTAHEKVKSVWQNYR